MRSPACEFRAEDGWSGRCVLCSFGPVGRFVRQPVFRVRLQCHLRTGRGVVRSFQNTPHPRWRQRTGQVVEWAEGACNVETGAQGPQSPHLRPPRQDDGRA